MKKLSLLFLILLPMISAQAGHPVEAGDFFFHGKTYPKSKAYLVELDKVLIESPQGSVQIAWKDAGPMLQSKLKYEREYLLKEQAAAPKQPDELSAGALGEMVASGAFKAGGKVLQVVPQGLLVECDYDGSNTCLPLNLFSGPSKTVLPGDTKLSSLSGVILLTDHPAQATIVDGNYVYAVVWPVGRFQYTAVDGAMKTVKKCSVKKPVAQ